MKRLFRSLSLLLLIVICAACSAEQTPAATPATDTTASAPLASPLTSPLATTLHLPRPSPDPKLGLVTGKLLLKSTSGDKPVPGRILYLAVLTKDAGGKETGAGLDRVNAPRTFSEGDGSFAFANVPVGRYALIMDMVTSAYLLQRPTDQTDLVADVKPGKTVDFGTLNYDQLPN